MLRILRGLFFFKEVKMPKLCAFKLFSFEDTSFKTNKFWIALKKTALCSLLMPSAF